jgi:hypothetical protein
MMTVGKYWLQIGGSLYMSQKDYRTVKLKHVLDLPRENGSETHMVTMSFKSYDNGPIPKAEDFGITDPDKIEKFNKLAELLISHDEIIFQWLEADAKNTILFAEDPVSALKRALPEISTKLLTFD